MDISLNLYRKKLVEAITLVPIMDFNSQLAAVELWNNTSSELQKIVHKSNRIHNQTTNVSGDDENFKPMQYMVAERCTSSTDTDCPQNGLEPINMNQIADSTNSNNATLTNSSGVTNQQYSPDKVYYESTYQETSNLSEDQLEHPFKNKINLNFIAQETTANYATVSNETLNCTVNPLQTGCCESLIDHHDLDNHLSSTNNSYDALRCSTILEPVSDEQVESSIVDIAADILASETYCPSISETIKHSVDHSSHTNNETALPEKMDKMQQLIIDSGEEFNNVVNIASSLSCQLPPNEKSETNLRSLEQFENSLEYMNYNTDNQVMSLSQDSSINTINSQMSTPDNQPLDQLLSFNSNFSNQTRCTMMMNSLFPCSKCNHQFESLPELDHHEKFHLREEELGEEANTNITEVKREVLDVSDCGEADNLANTSSQHNCDICHKSFSSAGNLKRHKRAHSGIKPYKCDYCDSAFTEKKSLVIHLRRHTGERPYKCDICGKLFSQSGVLNSHMSLHLDERKFKCPKCNKAFRQKSQLKLHLLRHDGVKRLECTTCMARFLVKADLTRHIRIHTGQRNFACGICDKMFTRKQSLNEHMNRHTGATPFYSLENSHTTKSPVAKLSSS